ncbi:MAG: hypothetical protein QOJ34_1722 [Pseudonocardiales bacterium]|jgi:hypothetical protein|nr:hypothetical protein [Pseudonocardiales bacterium]
MTALETAWQGALAAEEQAVFGYGLLGARLTGPHRERALTCLTDHEALRDATRAALAAAGLPPVPPAADYPALYPVAGPAAARALAARLEDDCAAAWRYLYLEAASDRSAPGSALREAAQQGLTDSAVRSTQWRLLVSPGRATRPFPGT